MASGRFVEARESAREARVSAAGMKALVYASEVPPLTSYYPVSLRLRVWLIGRTLMRCSKTGSKSSNCPSWKGYTPLEHCSRQHPAFLFNITEGKNIQGISTLSPTEP